MKNMIDITGIDLKEFAKKVYELSIPQGLGFLHFSSEPLTDEEAGSFITTDGLYMDYVKGRACKMTVLKRDGKLYIYDTWYDHTDKQLKELLCNFIKVNKNKKHDIGCNCRDCKEEGSNDR